MMPVPATSWGADRQVGNGNNNDTTHHPHQSYRWSIVICLLLFALCQKLRRLPLAGSVQRKINHATSSGPLEVATVRIDALISSPVKAGPGSLHTPPTSAPPSSSSPTTITATTPTSTPTSGAPTRLSTSPTLIPFFTEDYLDPSFDHNASMRSLRFPSIEDRVQAYLGSWYAPPCRDDDDQNSATDSNRVHFHFNGSLLLVWMTGLSQRVYEVHRLVQPDTMFYVDSAVLIECGLHDRTSMGLYCRDLSASLFPAIKQHMLGVTSMPINNESMDEYLARVPFLVQFGDSPSSRPYGEVVVPVIKKFRSVIDTTRLRQLTSPRCVQDVQKRIVLPLPMVTTGKSVLHPEPIIWKLETLRHYSRINDIPTKDIPWGEKVNKALFRGEMTGNTPVPANSTDLQKCLLIPRCRLVYQHISSDLVDAKLTSMYGRLPNMVNGVDLTAPYLQLEELLQYKAIIIMEGNDVSSALKWVLYSNSVVLMAPPTKTSWALEEKLVPWVHYIPCRRDMSDVESKMQWVLDHDTIASRVAQRATTWIYDLLVHPDAAKDERIIYKEMVRRYSAHFL